MTSTPELEYTLNPSYNAAEDEDSNVFDEEDEHNYESNGKNQDKDNYVHDEDWCDESQGRISKGSSKDSNNNDDNNNNSPETTNKEKEK